MRNTKVVPIRYLPRMLRNPDLGLMCRTSPNPDPLATMTPESPTSGLLSWHLTVGHQAVIEAVDTQIQAAPERFREVCDLTPDDLIPLLNEAIEPLSCAFSASVERISHAASTTSDEWPQCRLARGVRRVQLLAMHTPADFRHLVALRTDMHVETILGPVTLAFEAAYEPINRTVMAGVETAYALGCGLRAAMEAHSLPDTIPEDW